MSGIEQTFDAKCREHWNRMGYSKPEKLSESLKSSPRKQTSIMR